MVDTRHMIVSCIIRTTRVVEDVCTKVSLQIHGRHQAHDSTFVSFGGQWKMYA